jgi:hypothetical protein
VRTSCGRRLWRGPSAAEGGKAGVAMGGEMRAMLDDMDFKELTFHALRLIASRLMRQGPRISVSYNTQCFRILTFHAMLDTIGTYRHQQIA